MIYLAAYVVIIPVAALLIGLMDYRYEMRRPILSRREYMGFSILLGTLGGMMWPLMLPLVFLTTGFAEHGIWKQR